MTDVKQDDATPKPADDRGLRNFLMRVLTALVLIPVALGVAYAGGWLWAGLVTLVSVGLFIEWRTIVGAQRTGWIVLGVVYAAVALAASVMVRLDPVWGFSALIFVLLIVWVTDIGGYFAGRGIGGPKLWPRVSPKKTWAGAIGGLVLSLGVAAGFASYGIGRLVPLLVLATVLSVVSQLGDLFESAVKRRFGVKDSGHIIPGHGGLLDRLDGYVFAVIAAALLGLLRGGADGVGHGLMVW
ncbi:phosphatidate cytidylyltransferase [Tardiphaga sp.]|uniref:phosphatidate cytidylyltransferase n=1 Tax=Tardiphaga sp. TaxID=1926292 RepID=UPI00260681E4|nr:phosphatidate cytidylyltransferase [Tardiphaga sp.]MDB5620121.1 Phosphatidate cytidylyltransferase [Tardiphaga sp.]